MTDVPSVSVIVPLKDEPADVGAALARWWEDRGPTDAELLAADLGCPATEALRRAGARIVHAPAGSTRGARLALAVREARADTLFFVHADCRPPRRAFELLGAALDAGASGGAFSLAYAESDRTLAWIAAMANLRSRWLRLPFGDQGLFCTRSAYEAAGGFRDLPICDDLDLVRRLKRAGRFVVLPEPMTASPRAYRLGNPWRQTLRVWRVLAGYYLGVDASRLVRWYRGAAAHPVQSRSRIERRPP